MKKCIVLIIFLLMTAIPVQAQIKGSIKITDTNGNAFILLYAKADGENSKGLKGYLAGETFTMQWTNLKHLSSIEANTRTKKGYCESDIEMINGEKHHFRIYGDVILTGTKMSTKEEISIKLIELTDIYFIDH